MLYTCHDICRCIDAYAPPDFAEAGDPVGLHAGSAAKVVDRLFLALGLTPDVLEEALAFAADMIVVHHTPFYSPIRQLTEDDRGNHTVLELVRRGIALYTAHTNLDSVKGGVSDVLAGLLGLQDVEILQPLDASADASTDASAGTSADGSCYPGIDHAGLGRIGTLQMPMTLEGFARFAAEKLGTRGLRFVGSRDQSVYRVACCGGAGAYLQAVALAKGADTYVTADVKHHDGIQALESGLGLVDAGHFATESPIMPVLAAYLQERLPDLTIGLSARSGDPFTVV